MGLGAIAETSMNSMLVLQDNWHGTSLNFPFIFYLDEIICPIPVDG